jgi:hypothetical protein
MRPNNRSAGNILSEEYVGGQVILSGHETPGEGEHKIMDFIRYEKAQPGYDPNTRWASCGLNRSSCFLIFANTLGIFIKLFMSQDCVLLSLSAFAVIPNFPRKTVLPCDPA